MDPTTDHPAASGARITRMCRRTAVAFWVVASLFISLVGVIVTLAIVNRPGMRPGAYRMTVGKQAPQAVTVQGGQRSRPATPPATLPPSTAFVAAVQVLTPSGWLAAPAPAPKSAPAGLQLSATPATVYLYRASGADGYTLWMNGAGWLGAGAALTPDAADAVVVRFTAA